MAGSRSGRAKLSLGGISIPERLDLDVGISGSSPFVLRWSWNAKAPGIKVKDASKEVARTD